jgi:ABC-type uncharacterized transport system permease subunit
VWFAPLLATAATLVVGFIVFKAFGKDPIAAFDAFFIQPVATRMASRSCCWSAPRY